MNFTWTSPGTFPGGGGGTWVNFAGYVPLASQSPYQNVCTVGEK